MTDLPGIDLGALRARLAQPLDCAPDDLTIRLIDGGRSNLTYLLGDGDRHWVIRRPPLGHVLATAHDMDHEYRVMSALRGTGVPVPRMILAEHDIAVIGAPFFVMEFVDGPVIRNSSDAAGLVASDAARLGDDLIDHLAHLHGVDYAAAGLGDLGRPDGFMSRQIRRWLQQWHDSSETGDTAPVEQLAAALAAAVPARSDSSLVHGDYRLDNTILDADDPGRIAAIIDWEMATLGDPLADLGLLLTYWNPLSARVTGTTHALSTNPGFPTASQLAARYQARSGRDLTDLVFYIAFGHFKLAVIAQTIHARYRKALTVGPEFQSVGEAVPDLVDAAFAALAGSDGSGGV
jgi:aminoglycoside phosphotransferase (APT) family kinase protein